MTAGHEALPALSVRSKAEDPPDRTRLAAIALRISAVMFFIVGIIAALGTAVPQALDGSAASLPTSVAWLLCALSIALAVFIHFVVRGLHQRKPWAWKAAVVLSVLYVPSVFLPIGALGLFALLGKGTKAQFSLTSSSP